MFQGVTATQTSLAYQSEVGQRQIEALHEELTRQNGQLTLGNQGLAAHEVALEVQKQDLQKVISTLSKLEEQSDERLRVSARSNLIEPEQATQVSHLPSNRYV